MFYENQTDESKKEYRNLLELIGSLSNMFSDSSSPYLYYRIAERVFCQSFNSDDLSRSDVAIDSKFYKLGIGLKTFLKKNDKTFQKIAEFNKDRSIYENLPIKNKIEKISYLRNQRILFSKSLYELDEFIYHCVLRDEGKFYIYEEDMSLIDIDNISNIKSTESSIRFEDGNHEYNFNLSKSVLQKRFNTNCIIDSFDVSILENPLSELQKIFVPKEFEVCKKRIISTVYLPLYGNNFTVFEKSGLNQWNAKGRKRDINEVYIPIPAIVHKINPNFFPKRDDSFDLLLPNGKTMKSKVCQDGSKALMSYSNKELGKWILRDILHLKEYEILTYEKLQILGVDSIRIDKLSEKLYEINFAKKGSFEKYKNEEN